MATKWQNGTIPSFDIEHTLTETHFVPGACPVTQDVSANKAPKTPAPPGADILGDGDRDLK